MPEPFELNEPDTARTNDEPTPSTIVEQSGTPDSNVRQPLPDKLGEAFAGIIGSGFLYSVILVFVMLAIMAVEYSGFPLLIGLLGGLIMGLGLAFVFVAMIVTPVSLLAIGFTSLVAYTVIDRPSWPWVAGIAGGLTGFLLSCWVFARPDPGGDGWWWLTVFLGPVIGTIMGQLGGVWGTLRWQHLAKTIAGLPEDSARLRFDIRQILIATAWLAGILTLLKLTNILGPWSASIVAGWFVYQAATLWGIIHLVRKVRGYA